MSFLEVVATLVVLVPWWSAISHRLSVRGWRMVSRHLAGFVGSNFIVSICLMLIGGSPFGWGWLLVIVTFLLGFVVWANASDGRPMFDTSPPEKAGASVLPKPVADSPLPESEPASPAAVAPIASFTSISAPQIKHADTNKQNQQKLSELRQFCAGLVADGRLEEAEVFALARWLDKHKAVHGDALVRMLADYVREVVAEGSVSIEQAYNVYELAIAVADGLSVRDVKQKLPHAKAAAKNKVEPSKLKADKSTGGVRLNGALEDLRDMCQEMVSDGLMEESEVRELARYLDDHPWLESDGLIKLMAGYIREVLADGEVTPMEGMDVLDLAAAVAEGKTLKDMREWQPLAPVVDDEPPKVKRRSKAKSSKRKEGRTLDTIRFTYRDSKGDYSDRRVVVNVLDEEYFQGFCLSRNATRTFRLDRIVGDVTSETTGEIAQIWRWVDQIRREQAATR